MKVSARFGRLAWMSAATLVLSFVVQPASAQPAAPPAAPTDTEEVFGESDDAPATVPVAIGETKTIGVVALTNYDQLISDVNFLGGLLGQPNAAGAMEQQFGGEGVPGVDKTKPWGVIVQTDGMQVLPVGCLPVANADELLAAVEMFGIQVKDGGNDTKRIDLPGGRTVFVKIDKGWAFITQNPAALAHLPKDPQADFANLLAKENFDLAANVEAQNVPQMFRQLAVLAIQSSMQQQLRRQPNEADEEYVLRKKSVQAQMEQAVRQIQELDSLSFGWLVDAQQELSVMEFTYQFQPGSKTAAQFAADAPSQTNFSGFYQSDAAVAASIAVKADPDTIQQELAQFKAMMQGARTQFNKSVDESEHIPDQAARDALKAAAGEWFDAFEATISTGHVDAAASLKNGEDSVSLVAGAFTEEPAKFESGLKKLEAGLKGTEGFPGIAWNAATHAGVTFHTVSIPMSQAAEGPGRLLGDKAELAFGVGPNAIYIAVGPDNVAALEQAIDASQAEPNKVVPRFEMAVALGPVLDVVAEQTKDAAQREHMQSIADVLRNDAAGRDHVRVVGRTVPNGLKYRIEAEEGVLKAIGKAAADAKQQAVANQ